MSPTHLPSLFHCVLSQYMKYYHIHRNRNKLQNIFRTFSDSVEFPLLQQEEQYETVWVYASVCVWGEKSYNIPGIRIQHH